MTPSNLKRARRLLGWSQADLAKVLNLSQTTVATAETGSVNPRLGYAVYLCLWRAGLPYCTHLGKTHWIRKGDHPLQTYEPMTADGFAAAREGYGWSRSSIAKRIRVSRSTISRYESGVVPVPQIAAMALRYVSRDPR